MPSQKAKHAAAKATRTNPPAKFTAQQMTEWAIKNCGKLKDDGENGHLKQDDQWALFAEKLELAASADYISTKPESDSGNSSNDNADDEASNPNSDAPSL